MAEFQIETERLVLRDWRGEDLDALHALCTDPEVMATIGPLHDRDTTARLLERLQERAARDGCTFWAVEQRHDGRVIGFCGIGSGTVPFLEHELEIGWRLMRESWGRSLAYEAAQVSLRWMAEAHPARPLYAITANSNVRSRRLMERLGMERRADLDFEHPRIDAGSPLKPHVTYWMAAA